MALDLIPVRFTIKRKQMTIPNIGYKANSTYERDAIFDELERMGWPVRRQDNANDELWICKNLTNSHWWCYSFANIANEDLSKEFKIYPSPESFLAAAREALKPKYPNNEIWAKCASDFEIDGCIKALHDAGVRVFSLLQITPGKHDGIKWMSDEVCRCHSGTQKSAPIPLSEFMDIFLKPDNKRGWDCTLRCSDVKVEPKRETPPKIVGRKYRVTGNGNPTHGFKIGSDIELLSNSEHGEAYGLFMGEYVDRKCRQNVNMNCVELLPEEPWTAEYAKGQDVWVRGKVARSGKVLLVHCQGWTGAVLDPSQIKPA